MNYWFWLYIILVPLIVFAVKPEAPRWQRVGRLLLAIVLCYGLMLLSDRLHYELWAERLNNNPNTTHKEFMELAGASGAASVFLLFLGWLYSATYVGWWEMLWERYHKRFTKRIHDDYQCGRIRKIIIAISKGFTAFVFVFIGLIVSMSIVSAALEKQAFTKFIASICR